MGTSSITSPMKACLHPCEIVFELLEAHLSKGYHVFMDNYYNFVSLAKELYAHLVHCSGTLCLTRGAPPSLKSLTARKVTHNELYFCKKGEHICHLLAGRQTYLNGDNSL